MTRDDLHRAIADVLGTRVPPHAMDDVVDRIDKAVAAWCASQITAAIVPPPRQP